MGRASGQLPRGIGGAKRRGGSCSLRVRGTGRQKRGLDSAENKQRFWPITEGRGGAWRQPSKLGALGKGEARGSEGVAGRATMIDCDTKDVQVLGPIAATVGGASSKGERARCKLQ